MLDVVSRDDVGGMLGGPLKGATDFLDGHMEEEGLILPVVDGLGLDSEEGIVMGSGLAEGSKDGSKSDSKAM